MLRQYAVKRVSEAIASLKPQCIKMPDAPEADVIKRNVYDIALISLISKKNKQQKPTTTKI